MIKAAIALLVEYQDLSESQMIEVMQQVMGGEATPAQMGAFLVALRMKGETVAELVGAARVMRERATHIRVSQALDLDREEINIDRETVLDTCGTGGAGTRTFNVSTTVAFVVAACGVPMAKHGNRSVSSTCGSADVLEALGLNLDVTPEQVARAIEQLGIGFLYAPALHGAMKHAIGPRREVGVRSIFNLLGPLTNPAGARYQVLGVYHRSLVRKMAQVLRDLGCKRGFVVHGEDGMDEATITGSTWVAAVDEGKVEEFVLQPEEYGLQTCELSALQGGDAQQNAAIVRGVLAGESGPRRDVVLLNSALALVAAERATDIADGLRQAAAVLDNGQAAAKLQALIEFTHADPDTGA